jgi:hypothetical protein
VVFTRGLTRTYLVGDDIEEGDAAHEEEADLRVGAHHLQPLALGSR